MNLNAPHLKWLILLLLFSISVYSQEYKVTYVVDGDTADVEACGLIVRLRFLDINTPERGKPGYKEAKEYLKKRILNKTVTLKTEGKGRYGRTLAYVYYDGVEINKELYCLGYAKKYRLSEREFNCN